MDGSVDLSAAQATDLAARTEHDVNRIVARQLGPDAVDRIAPRTGFLAAGAGTVAAARSTQRKILLH
jgi:hypothetical protein